MDSLRPVVKATLVNPSLDDYENIIVVALLFDEKDNAIAVSKTEVSRLSHNSSKELTFILSRDLKQPPARIDVIPRFSVLGES